MILKSGILLAAIGLSIPGMAGDDGISPDEVGLTVAEVQANKAVAFAAEALKNQEAATAASKKAADSESSLYWDKVRSSFYATVRTPGKAVLKEDVAAVKAGIVKTLYSDATELVDKDTAQLEKKDLEKINAAYDKADKAAADYGNAVKELNQKNSDYQAKLTDATVKATTATEMKNMANAERKALVEQLKVLNFNSDYTNLVSKMSDGSRLMAALERKYDRSVMAAYMQQKMTALLNSDSLCKAAASCGPDGTNKKVINDQMLNEVFKFSGRSSGGQNAAPPPATAPVADPAAQAK